MTTNDTITKGTTEDNNIKGARAAARQLIERSRRLLHETPDYSPITYKQASELAEKIVEQDDDVRAWMFIVLLHGIVAAYIEERKAAHAKTSYTGPTVEGLVFEATRNAFTKTTLCLDSQREFTELTRDTVELLGDTEFGKPRRRKCASS
jgi:hypothetical protein